MIVLPRIAAASGRFRADRAGASAVEFALILPFMLLLFLGTFQLTRALELDRKVTLLSRTVSDLVSQATTVTAADVNGIFDAATSVLYPFDPAKAEITITAVWTEDNKSKVEWICKRGGSCTKPKNQEISIEAAPTVGGTILAEVKYDYDSPIAYAISGSYKLARKTQTRPRASDRVAMQ